MKNELDIPVLKKQFKLYLESLKNLTPQGLAEITGFIISLGDSIKVLTAKPQKTDQDYEDIQLLNKEVSAFIARLSEAQIVMRKTEWKNTEAYYEKLKNDAAGGDPTAVQVFKDFEPVYLEMRNRMMQDDKETAAVPVSSVIENLHKS